MIVAASLFLVAQAQAPFDFAGKLKDICVQGKYGVAKGGLPASISLGAKGEKIEPTAFELKLPDGTAAKLIFENPLVNSNIFTADVKLVSSGQSIQGVRLDLSGVLESYTEAGTAKQRAQSVESDFPFYYGDFKKDEERTQHIRIAGLKFNPETTDVRLNFNLSGIQYMGQVDLGSITVTSIDSEPKGTLLISADEGILRVSPVAKKVETVVKGEDFHVGGVAADPAGGFWAAVNNNLLLKFNAAGKEVSRTEADGDQLYWLTLCLRLAGGTLYNSGDNQRGWQAIKSGKRTWFLAAEEDSATCFDVDAKGNLYGTNTKKVFYVPAGAEAAKVLIDSGPEGRLLGTVTHPVACRLDGKGQLYVTEGFPGEEVIPRMSVFDLEGHIVRIFGRGSNSAPPADETWPGQVVTPTDLAFGPDGTVYILSSHPGASAYLMIYRPF